MDKFSHWIQQISGLSASLQTKIFFTFLIIFVLWLIRFIFLKIIYSRINDVMTRHQWRRTSTYVVVILGVLLIGRFWFEAFQSISTFLGLLAAGIAVALKELIVNFAAWIFILIRRPFELGDRIEVKGQSGDVIDLQIFQFSILEIGNWVDADQSTGRILHIPNGIVFNQTIANFNRGLQYLWNEIPILITFESDWEKAKQLFLDMISEETKGLAETARLKVRQARWKYPIRYTNLEPIVYTSVKDSGVMLTIRYLCEPRQRRSSEQAIWEKILRIVASANDVDFAYPTQRFYNNPVEGKPGKRKAED